MSIKFWLNRRGRHKGFGIRHKAEGDSVAQLKGGIPQHDYFQVQKDKKRPTAAQRAQLIWD